MQQCESGAFASVIDLSDYTGHLQAGKFTLTAALTGQIHHALSDGQSIVLPTDTVYGIGCLPRTEAVNSMLAAKGRGRHMPPPVLVGAPTSALAITRDLPAWGEALMEQLWPGALTIIAWRQPNLDWDLGDKPDTIAVRMPNHPVTLAVLDEVGPLAVTSANLTGQPAASNCSQAQQAFGEQVSLYLDAGPTGHSVASTIIDATGPVPKLIRSGQITAREISRITGEDVELD